MIYEWLREKLGVDAAARTATRAAEDCAALRLRTTTIEAALSTQGEALAALRKLLADANEVLRLLATCPRCGVVINASHPSTTKNAGKERPVLCCLGCRPFVKAPPAPLLPSPIQTGSMQTGAKKVNF